MKNQTFFMKMTAPAEDGGVDKTVSHLSPNNDGKFLVVEVSAGRCYEQRGGLFEDTREALG